MNPSDVEFVIFDAADESLPFVLVERKGWTFGVFRVPNFHHLPNTHGNTTTFMRKGRELETLGREWIVTRYRFLRFFTHNKLLGRTLALYGRILDKHHRCPCEIVTRHQYSTIPYDLIEIFLFTYSFNRHKLRNLTKHFDSWVRDMYPCPILACINFLCVCALVFC